MALYPGLPMFSHEILQNMERPGHGGRGGVTSEDINQGAQEVGALFDTSPPLPKEHLRVYSYIVTDNIL